MPPLLLTFFEEEGSIFFSNSDKKSRVRNRQGLLFNSNGIRETRCQLDFPTLRYAVNSSAVPGTSPDIGPHSMGPQMTRGKYKRNLTGLIRDS